METLQNENTLHYGDEKALNILLLNESGFAEIIDFSERGATCKIYTSHAAREFEDKGVDLFNCLAGQYLKGLPCRVVYCIKQSTNNKHGKGRHLYQVEFPNLCDEKKKELAQFIEDGYQHFTTFESEVYTHH